MATKKIHEQWSRNLYLLVLRTFAVVIGIVGAVQVALHGTGTQSSSPMRGLKGALSSWLRTLEAQGHGDLVRWIVVAMFGFVALYAMFWEIQSILHITPGLTRLGRSIRKQASPLERFKDVCAQIDQDMEGGYQEFGAGVYVSSSWILEEEAMRLTRIKKIICKSGFGKNGLELVDVDGNCMKIDFVLKQPAREALAYLKKTLPLVKVQGEEDD